MDAAIIYETAWGNTKAIAAAVGEGLSSWLDVNILNVATAPPAETLRSHLLIVGAPTHAFGLSRPQTREDAGRRGGDPPAIGLREWIEAADHVRLPVAAFDTHVLHPKLPGAASRTAAKLLRRRGATLLTAPETFYVEGYQGPIVSGEVERARTWGKDLAARLPEATGAL
ncbi:MAG TPA: flavodoxin/nitric oxide synthase [Beutenbergiaceae bacterium]|nr:flavodoxin/nitric oxide synthase [Beutenbergiaceae bacterium]